MELRCVLIDDEVKSRDNLRELLREYCPSVTVAGEAGSAAEALKLIKQDQPDIVFLDIEMGNISGFDLLKLLNGNQHFEVIFVTAFDKYGIQAVKACAIDYLLKPINVLELCTAVEKASQQIKPKQENKRLQELIANIDRGDEEQKIAIPLTDKIEFVAITRIIRLEAEGNYTNIYLEGNKRYLVCKTLKEYHELLDRHQFLRTHQSHLINLRKITAYVKTDGGYISMEDGSQIPISRQKKEEILKKILR